MAPRVRQEPLSRLRANPANPRTITQARLDQLKHSLEADPEMLHARPCIALPDGTVIAGNQRLQAASELGWKTIPTITVDLDEARAAQWLLRDNQEYGEWDDSALAMMLEDLQALDSDLALTGFPDDEVSRLLDSLVEPPRHADDVPDTPITPTTQPGDLVELGPHRLYCGDATDAHAYDALLGTNQADCVWTDPPYNVDYTGATADALTMQNDAMTDPAYAMFLTDAFTAAAPAAKLGAPIYVAHSDLNRHIVTASLATAGWTHRQTLIWVKNTFVLTRQDYQWQHESILYGWRDGAAHPWHGGFDKTTILSDDKPARSLTHPTMKPVHLVMQMLQNSSKRGDIILDPFAGSGTTLIAADLLDRTACLIELDPAYCDVIRTRYQNHRDAS